MPPDDLTMGELARAVARIEASMINLRAELANLPYQRADVAQVERATMENRILVVQTSLSEDVKDIRSSLSRATQIAVSGLLLPIIVGTLFLVANFVIGSK